MQLHIRTFIGIPRCARNNMIAEHEHGFIKDGLHPQFSFRSSNRLLLLNTVTGMPFYDA